MQISFLSSILLHLLVLFIAFYGLPNAKKKNDYLDKSAIVLDVVDIAEITNIQTKKSNKKSANKKSANKNDKKVEKKAQSVKSETPVKEPKAGKEKIKDIEKIPTKKTPAKKVAENSKPASASTVSKKSKRKKDDVFEKAILKSVEDHKKESINKKIDDDFDSLTDALKGYSNAEYNNNIPMTLSEIDSIKSQITKNWNTTAFSGANSLGMQVTVTIELDIHGKVLSVTPKRQYNKSDIYNSFVESTVRAIKRSSPITKLDPKKFKKWQKIEFNFDSEGMVY